MKKLLMLARKAILSELTNKPFNPRITNDLLIKRGVFVTLTINNRLRGCIGFIKPLPIGEGVIRAAINSAFNDPRFNPLTLKEFNKVSIEVSLLNKPVKCSVSDIKKGDGVIIESNGRSALFLPQVWDELPDKKLFLEQLCLKAGLRSDCYNNAVIKKFSVESATLKPVNP